MIVPTPQHGIATIAGLVQVSGSLPRFGFITVESDEARKSATVAIPGPLAHILEEINRMRQKKYRLKDTTWIVGFVSVLLSILAIFYFFNRDVLNYTPLEYGVILNDKKHYSESYIHGWHKIDAKTFYIETPIEFKFFLSEGIDSYVGGLTNEKDTFFFDYGYYSNSLTDFSPSEYKIFNEIINDRRFRVVIGQNEIQYIAAYTDELKNDLKLMIECPNCSDLEEKLKIIQTIELKSN
jgi:hypothetical protein